jgi:hypothetical protein
MSDERTKSARRSEASRAPHYLSLFLHPALLLGVMLAGLQEERRPKPSRCGRGEGPVTRARRPALVVGSNASWFDPPRGPRVRCGRRPVIARIVHALASRRLDEPGRGFTCDELLSIGWPGERMLRKSAKNRVYVTVSRLRRLGLGEALVVRDGVYLLDPSLEVRIEHT